MRMGVAVLVGCALPATAEPLPGCNDGSIHRMITGWHGAGRDWVEFFSQAPASPDGGFLFDRWTLLHCPTGVGVGVRGFAPFPYPSDDPSAPELPETAESRAIHRAIVDAVHGHEIPPGQRGADEVASRLREAGATARTGPGDKRSCVCDPGWTG
ncbi:MAG: hypothetical protein KF887_10485 [Paracoccaceae bacterium]|nr:MAG: hypothetical protein KF887_10485 [Paracoccaceae bacterium]